MDLPHANISAIIRNSHIYKKRTEMLSLLFMALFIFISFPKGLYNINSTCIRQAMKSKKSKETSFSKTFIAFGRPF